MQTNPSFSAFAHPASPYGRGGSPWADGEGEFPPKKPSPGACFFFRILTFPPATNHRDGKPVPPSTKNKKL